MRERHRKALQAGSLSVTFPQAAPSTLRQLLVEVVAPLEVIGFHSEQLLARPCRWVKSWSLVQLIGCILLYVSVYSYLFVVCKYVLYIYIYRYIDF